MNKDKQSTTTMAERFIEETTATDSKQRAKNTVEYEQMLMAFIEDEFKGM